MPFGKKKRELEQKIEALRKSLYELSEKVKSLSDEITALRGATGEIMPFSLIDEWLNGGKDGEKEE